MTTKLYWIDQYLTEFSAVVVAANGNELVLDQTAFYPGGGGQPSDSGTITVGGTEFAVVGVRAAADTITHALGTAAALEPGSQAECRIDWDKRYRYMRYHTALHIIDGIVEKRHKGRVTGGQIYYDRARMDFDMPSMDKELSSTIIEEANLVVSEGHQVVAAMLERDEALAKDDLVRTETGRELISGLEKVRVINIVGFDMQSDGGTHVSNTKEVGTIRLSRFDNKGAHNKRVEITVP